MIALLVSIMKYINEKVAIIIVNYNNCFDTTQCLDSLKEIDYNYHEIYIVDNNSTNDSVLKLDRYISNYPKKIHFIKSNKNLGFAGGNNLAIRKALESDFDYFLLLNNDTVVEKDFLSEMLSIADRDDNIGIIGPKIRYFHNPQLIWYAGGYIDWFRFSGVHYGLNEIDRGQYDQIREVSFITGCCMLIKREVIEKVGLLCEDYFLYNEDLDYCVRVMDSGYKLIYNPKSVIYHKVGQSSGGEKSPVAIRHFVRSKKLFFKKFGYKVSKINYLISYSLWIQYTLLKGILAIIEGKIDEGKAYLEGLFNN